MSALSCKVQLEGTATLRRFALERDNVRATALRGKLRQLFPELGTVDFSITWRDDDGDWVSIVNDDDVGIAVETAEGSTLRLRVTTLSTSSASRPPIAEEGFVAVSEPAANLSRDTSSSTHAPQRSAAKEEKSAAPKAPKASRKTEERPEAPPPPPPPGVGDEEVPFRVFIEGLCSQAPQLRRLVAGFAHFHESEPVAEGAPLPAVVLSPGSHGPGVEQLQRVLIAYGLMPAAAIRCRAGVYGPFTARAIGEFQRIADVSTGSTGVYDAATRQALIEHFNLTDGASQPPPASAPPRAPPTSARFAAELEGLRAMGFDNVDALIPLLEQFKGSIEQILAVLLDDAR